MTNNALLLPNNDPDGFETIQVNFEDLETMWWDFLGMQISSSPKYDAITLMLDDAFGSLANLPVWLVQIADNKVPKPIPINATSFFEVRPVSNDRLEFRVLVRSAPDKKTQCIMHVIVRRKQLVSEFSKKLRRFAKDNYLPGGWGITAEQLKLDADNVMISLRKSSK